VQDDINALTQDSASIYSSTINDAIQSWGGSHGFSGHILYLGPTTLGTWTTPPDRYVLQGFKGNVDAWQYGGVGTFTQAELDFVNTYMGDVGLIEGEYRTANAQSPFSWPNSSATHVGSIVTVTVGSPNNFSTGWQIDAVCADPTYNVAQRTPQAVTSTTVTYTAAQAPTSSSTTCNVYFSDKNVGGFPSQAARGQDFFNKVSILPARAYTSTGTRPYVGYLWWQFTDNEAEQKDWGVVTNRDNSYDNFEVIDSIVGCSGLLQIYSCGGELRGPYGDLISFVKQTNAAIDATLLGLP
jgi:FlaG/FlaF family flagellin (archaellin)